MGRRRWLDAMEKEGGKEERHNSPLFLLCISISHSLDKSVGKHTWFHDEKTENIMT